MIEIISEVDGETNGIFESKEKFFEYLEENNVRYIERADGIVEMFDGLEAYGGWIDDVYFVEVKMNVCRKVEYLTNNGGN